MTERKRSRRAPPTEGADRPPPTTKRQEHTASGAGLPSKLRFGGGRRLTVTNSQIKTIVGVPCSGFSHRTTHSDPRGRAWSCVYLHNQHQDMKLFMLAALIASAQAFAVLPGIRATPASVAQHAAVTPAVASAAARVANVQMGLFGLGTPELAVIAGIALLVLGPDQVKKLAKDVGKVSAELKQVPEEFNKGMEAGAEELAKKKEVAPAADAEPEKPPSPPAA